jgi:hypothetical protein
VNCGRGCEAVAVVTIGPSTIEEAGAVVRALYAGTVDVVVAGYWAIVAFETEYPSPEGQAWLVKHPLVGPIDLACPTQDRAAAEMVLAALGFRLREETERELRLENDRNCVVHIWLFRRASDGGRIYPGGGPAGEDWYYPPECVTTGRLGSVLVRTEGPEGLARTRTALPSDLK